MISIFLAVAILGLVVSILPETPMPEQISEAFLSLFGLLYTFDFIIPFSTVIDVLYISLFLEVVFMSVYAVLFLYRLTTKIH